MATLADTGYPTIKDVMQTLAPNGSVESRMANVLTKKCPILEDAPYVEGNLPTGHQIVSVTALPSMSSAWRRLNSGVPTTKGQTAQYVETCGILEDYSKVDVDVAKLNGNAAAYRATQDKLKKEAFAQEGERAIFYESSLTNPEKIHGLTSRYPATTGYTASSYVLKGTNAGANCHSLWLINWEPEKLFLIYPKGSQAGLLMEDRGQQTITDSSNNSYEAYVSRMQWKFGVAVMDYRQAVRYQWDPDDANFADSAKGLILAMQQMLNTVQDVGPGTRFYMNRTTRSKLDAQLLSNDANLLTYLESGRGRIPAFMDIPMRISDTFVAETAIS